MKNLTTILLLFFIPTILIGQNLKALDEKYGFREAKFEMPFDSFKNLVKNEKDFKDFYKSTNEDLNLGEYVLDRVYYGFYKGQLATIIIKTKGYTNSRGVLSIFQQAYGKGYKINQIEEYIWSGKKVYMSYDQDSIITDDATIFIFSVKLTDLEEADKKRADSEAAKKL
ncbi:MAG: hypothetical protein WCS03_18160 [Bacteroidota bacterium]